LTASPPWLVEALEYTETDLVCHCISRLSSGGVFTSIVERRYFEEMVEGYSCVPRNPQGGLHPVRKGSNWYFLRDLILPSFQYPAKFASVGTVIVPTPPYREMMPFHKKLPNAATLLDFSFLLPGDMWVWTLPFVFY
jgi:hypothetical protein